MDLCSAWQEEHQNEYKKENQAPGKIVEESRSLAGAHFGGGGGGKEKNPQNRRIGLGLKKEKKYRQGMLLQKDKCDNKIIGRRQNFLAQIL